MKRQAYALAAGALTVMAGSHAYGQADWPSRPITLVVPFPAGGGTDAFARPLAALVNKQVGRQVVIDNRGGAGGTLGAGIAARAAPDGYTYFIGAVHHAIAPSVYAKLDYDIERDLVPLTSIAHVPQVIVVNPARVKANDLKELIATAQKAPGKLAFASAGNGTSHHLAGELFKILTKTDILHVPYKGAGPAMTDLVGGQVDMMFDGMGSSAGQIKGGKIRALAVAAKERVAGFPNIPTTIEAGLPAYQISTWYGVWAPKGTPAAILDRMHKEIARALTSPEAKEIWLQQGAAAGGEPPAEFAKFLRAEIERWGRVAKEAGARID